jgi:hypothetical protein
METFTIFHGYTDHAITPEERHEKRVQLEPLIYDILKAKYSKALSMAWKSIKIPRPSETRKTVVIVEPRLHSNLQFLMHNVAYYCKDWALTIVCSNENLEYCKVLGEHHRDVITYLPLFQFQDDRELARGEYNRLLKSAEFYEQIPCENMLITQTDSYFRRHMSDTIMKYDYVSSPFSWDKEHQGGGISFRKKSVMLNICANSKRKIESEDVFTSCSIKEMGYKMPKWEEALIFFCESTLFAQTIGVHQWWTFLRHVQGTNQCKQVFHALLTLEL